MASDGAQYASTSASSERIEFRMLDFAAVGDDTVSFKLEDGTVVRVKVSLERVGVATNYRNPDGTAHYAVNTAVKLYIIPHDKKFTMPKSQVSGGAVAAAGGGSSSAGMAAPAATDRQSPPPPSHIA